MAFGSSYGQDKNQPQDSTNIYNKIETFSKKGKFTKFLHKLIFKSNDQKPRKTKKIDTVDYSVYKGKTIRSIEIEVMDPFGFSFTNPEERANSWVEKFGNQVHLKSKKFTIRNLLLFKADESLDPLAVRESERLIRSQNYIRSVRIEPTVVSAANDSVDLKIRVLDSWSLIPEANVSTSKTNLRLKERNFMGLGHQFNVGMTQSHENGNTAYNLQYRLSNFKNTYINTTLGYRSNLNEFHSKFLDVSREFYSPLTRWAGGLYLDEQFYEEGFIEQNDSLSYQNIKSTSTDVWGAMAFQIFKGSSENERTTNLITSLRFLDYNFKESPDSQYDPIDYYSNEHLVMGSVGIASRQFVRDSYIFQDGFTEDVPVGSIYSVTGGTQRKNDQDRWYFGARVAYGKYFKWGYLSTNFEYGTFINDSRLEQSAYLFQANYFTNLMSLGNKWKVRQFVKPQFLIGTNRLNSPADRLSLDENREFDGFNNLNRKRTNDARIPGFNSDILGTKKFVLALQTQFYSPWDVLGFRLNPFINLTGGLIGDEDTSVSKSKLYSSLGIGFIIRNDYLVFSNFQISLAYYPNAPFNQNNFETNAFETEDFGFQRFDLGKPMIVEYN